MACRRYRLREPRPGTVDPRDIGMGIEESGLGGSVGYHRGGNNLEISGVKT